MTDERFKRLLAVLIALATLAATVIAFLQSDAGARDDRANRDARRYTFEAFGRRVSGDARVNFDYNRAYQAWYELNLLADSAEAREDLAAADRYRAVRDELTTLSPLLAEPYFNPETGEPNAAQYESDTYVVEITALTERYLAAAVVKDAWDAKANAYVFHITLLAVALFLFGLAATLNQPATRWIFTGVGGVIAIVAVAQAALAFFQPVADRRDQAGAIDAYARGVGLAYQDRHEEALTAFTEALTASPDYANAFVARAGSQGALGRLAEAAADFEAARANGNTAANVAGELAWDYYLLGRLDDAVAMNRLALAAGGGDLWIQFDLALALLAKGDVAGARAEYQAGIDAAARQVADAAKAGQQPPSDVWWSLDDGAASLDGLLYEPPPGAAAVDAAVAEDLITQLKSAAVALEYTGQLPAGALTATISPFTFSAPVYDDQGSLIETLEDEVFEFGVNEIGVLFDYAGMTDGQDVVFKVYINGEEDPSWRVIAPWDLGADGAAEKTLSLAYSDNFVLAAGDYEVEMYVDGRLAQRGAFAVVEP